MMAAVVAITAPAAFHGQRFASFTTGRSRSITERMWHQQRQYPMSKELSKLLRSVELEPLSLLMSSLARPRETEGWTVPVIAVAVTTKPMTATKQFLTTTTTTTTPFHHSKNTACTNTVIKRPCCSVFRWRNQHFAHTDGFGLRRNYSYFQKRHHHSLLATASNEEEEQDEVLIVDSARSCHRNGDMSIVCGGSNNRNVSEMAAERATGSLASAATTKQEVSVNAKVSYRNDSNSNGSVSFKKHCRTCSCDEPNDQDVLERTKTATQRPKGMVMVEGQGRYLEPSIATTDDEPCPFSSSSAFETIESGAPLPLPLPEPKVTFLRRVLKSKEEGLAGNTVTALDSRIGRSRLLRALQQETAHSYWALQNHFANQSEPTYCGVTTLLVVLNALAIDPLRRWKGGWRYYGHEDVLLHNCTCLEPERIRRTGLTLPQFAQLAACQGLTVHLKRPFSNSSINNSGNEKMKQNSNDELQAFFSLDEFRHDVVKVLTTPPKTGGDAGDGKGADGVSSLDAADSINLTSLLVVSYARSSLGQTGDSGHFAPLAAYDPETDSVLILDVARFKYPPYWVSLPELYYAMAQPLDPVTQQSRGWFVLDAPPISHWYQGSTVRDEVELPAPQIPAMDEPSPCPGQTIKVEYCPNNKQH